MFSFTKKDDLKKAKATAAKARKAERDAKPLDKKGRKEGRMLLRGIRKFIRYNDDLIDDDRRELIEEKREAFSTALEDRTQTRGELEQMAEDLTDTCKNSVKSYRPSAMKENIEVIFVAVVIAMGIRAYFIQQFKIPTGSMQPTMNGIIAWADKEMNPNAEYMAPDDYEKPGILERVWDKIWYGRSHIEWISTEDDGFLFDQKHFYDENPALFFPRTYLITANGNTYSAPGTKSRVKNLLNLKLRSGMKIKKGEVIAKGFIDTGDQLVVDKFTYHWRKPKRGDVFVFHTRDIYGIQAKLDDPRLGSLHYIKRLVGTPGDKLDVEPPFLKVNGKTANEFGIRRVMAKEGRYTGYTRMGHRLPVTLGEKEYWAMGDNSSNSSDSRDWGVVPQRNIVGRAAVVYYPFGHHFGKIR